MLSRDNQPQTERIGLQKEFTGELHKLMADHKKMLAGPEAEHALNCRAGDALLKAELEAQDRKSERYRRQMDREIFSARQGLADINARTPSPRLVRGQEREKSGFQSDTDTDLLASKTKRNMVLSQKISTSLEVKRQQREASPLGYRGNSPSTLKVSPRAVEDLERAARVLKNTPHEAEVLKLLSTVVPGESPRSPRSPRRPRS